MKKPEFDAMCEELGITCDITKSKGSAYLTCWAPEGKIFVESGCNVLSSFDYGGRKGYMDDLRSELNNMIECGFEDGCTDEEPEL